MVSGTSRSAHGPTSSGTGVSGAVVSSPGSGACRPDQPIHTASWLRSAGSSALTSPPGERAHVVPFAPFSAETGSRFATTTKSNVFVGGMSRT